MAYKGCVVDLHKKYGNNGHIVVGTDNCDIRELICQNIAKAGLSCFRVIIQNWQLYFLKHN